MKPLRDLVLIKDDDSHEVSQGGIYIPEGAREKIYQGVVMEVGPDCKDLKVGDEVVFNKFIGTDITHCEMPFTILQEQEVLARYE